MVTRGQKEHIRTFDKLPCWGIKVIPGARCATIREAPRRSDLESSGSHRGSHGRAPPLLPSCPRCGAHQRLPTVLGKTAVSCSSPYTSNKPPIVTAIPRV